MKNVKVVSTVGTKVKPFQTEAKTWGEFKSELGAEYPISELKAIVGETKNTLEQDGAELPVTDFSLFLIPQKVKSGSKDWGKEGYKSLREEIKRLKGILTETVFKGAFGNYTQFSTEQLQNVVSLYYSKKNPIKAPQSSKETVVKEEVIQEIPALAVRENVTVTFNVPVEFIPAGIYVIPLTEEMIKEVQKTLK